MRDAVPPVALAGRRRAGTGRAPCGSWMERTGRLTSSGSSLGDRVEPHRNDEVEVLVVVVLGPGVVTVGGQVHPLAPMALIHVPNGNGQGSDGG